MTGLNTHTGLFYNYNASPALGADLQAALENAVSVIATLTGADESAAASATAAATSAGTASGFASAANTNATAAASSASTASTAATAAASSASAASTSATAAAGSASGTATNATAAAGSASAAAASATAAATSSTSAAGSATAAASSATAAAASAATSSSKAPIASPTFTTSSTTASGAVSVTVGYNTTGLFGLTWGSPSATAGSVPNIVAGTGILYNAPTGGDHQFRINNVYPAAMDVTAAGTSVPNLITPSLNGGQLSGNRSRIINGGFLFNQRGYASGTSLAAGVYGHDRWKGGPSGGTYTFTQGSPDTTITITVGTLQQVIEGYHIEGGSYVLSWTGTATARVGSGSYAASPVLVTGITAGANTTVEFGTGTVGKVQFEPGAVATVFERRLLSAEFAACQRYFQTGNWGIGGYATAGVGAFNCQQFPTPMRASPTLTYTLGGTTNISVGQPNGLSNTSYQNYAVATATGGFSAFGTFTASAEL